MTGALRASVFLLNYYPPPGKINNSSIAFINVSSLISFHTIPISVYAMILIHLSKKGKHFYDFYSLVPRLKFLPLYIVVFISIFCIQSFIFNQYTKTRSRSVVFQGIRIGNRRTWTSRPPQSGSTSRSRSRIRRKPRRSRGQRKSAFLRLCRADRAARLVRRVSDVPPTYAI